MHAQSVCQAGQAMKEGNKVLGINRSINEVIVYLFIIIFFVLYFYSEIVYLADRI